MDGATKNICKKWNKIKLQYPNNLFNPITNRNIIKFGPKYIELEKLCKKLKITEKELEDIIINKNINKKEIIKKPVTKKICKLWKNNKNINPITNRIIKINGPIYRELSNKCI